MRTWGFAVRSLTALCSLALLAGCLGAPQPVEQREEFQSIRARVGTQIDRPVQIRVAGQTGATASHSAEEYRLTLPDPSSDLSDRIVGAVKALGAFASVTNGDGPAPPGAIQLEVRCKPNTVTYDGANGWLGVSFTAWSFGLPAAFWVDDEDYTVAGGWEVILTDTASGKQLARHEIPIGKTLGLNDWERSFSILDLLLYHAAPIDEARLTKVHKLITPHGEADATLALCEWLVEQGIATVPAPETPAKPDPVEPPVKPDPVEPPVKPDPVEPPVKPDPDPPVVPEVTRDPATFALCIGVAAYAGDAAAPYAAADAQLIAATLQALGKGDTQTTTLSNSAATKAAIERWLQARADNVVEGDHIIVFFAGRGATTESGEPVLLPHDGSVASAESSGISLTSLCERLQGAAGVTLLLDCAFQGRLEERGPEGTALPKPAAEWLPANAAMVAAAYGSGEATTGAKPNGLFTQHLAAALAVATEPTAQSLLAAIATGVRAEARSRGVLQIPAAAGADHRIAGKQD